MTRGRTRKTTTTTMMTMMMMMDVPKASQTRASHLLRRRTLFVLPITVTQAVTSSQTNVQTKRKLQNYDHAPDPSKRHSSLGALQQDFFVNNISGYANFFPGDLFLSTISHFQAEFFAFLVIYHKAISLQPILAFFAR